MWDRKKKPDEERTGCVEIEYELTEILRERPGVRRETRQVEIEIWGDPMQTSLRVGDGVWTKSGNS